MNVQPKSFKKFIAATTAALVLSACATPGVMPDGAAAARAKLTQLQSDAELASRAPIEIRDAELAVTAAERKQQDVALGQHLVLMADHKVEIASAWAQSRRFEDERVELSAQAETARLDSRTREADRARSDADRARSDADRARTDTGIALDQAAQARQEADDLQRQITELNAEKTDRGLVVTLGDVLFETGRADLQGGATNNLDTLAAFLNKYTERTVIIEGYTDNVGSESSNLSLSQNRADAVRNYMVNRAVASSRLSTSGKGEEFPVASNDSSSGRQQNRRVEVIISNPDVLLK